MRLSKDSVRVPRCLCINCGDELDAVSAVSDDPEDPGRVTANPGDITVCITCGWISVFDKDLRLRAPTVEEMIDVASDERIVAAIGAVTLRNKLHGRKFPMKGTKQ